jgi:hypothetical protein
MQGSPFDPRLLLSQEHVLTAIRKSRMGNG